MISDNYNPVMIEDSFSRIKKWRQQTSIDNPGNFGNLVGDVAEGISLRRVQQIHPNAKITNDLRSGGDGLYIRPDLKMDSGNFDYVVVRKTETASGTEFNVEAIYEVTNQAPTKYKESEQVYDQLSDLRNGNRELKTRSDLSGDDFSSLDPDTDRHTIGPRNYHKSQKLTEETGDGYDYAHRYTSDEVEDVTQAYKQHKLEEQ